MITTSQIVDKLLPFTKADDRCGFNKKVKMRARMELIILIDDYKSGKAVELPDEVKKLLL